MKNIKSKRLIFRTVILIGLFILMGYALYQNLIKDNATGLELGDQAPNFKLELLTGNEKELHELKGKVVLVNFWGTWCEPCKREMPAIQSVYDEYKSKGFEVLAVNLGESDIAVTRFEEENNFNFPMLLDKTNTVGALYNVNLIPSSFFIDENGKIVKKFEGEMKVEELKQWIESML